MGDAGSGFLGITVAAYSLLAGYSSPPLFWSWLILFGVFIVDADITLLRRLARGERVHEAHRSHAYQHAAVACRGHKRVVLAVGVLNVVWLFPLAAAVAMGSLDGRFGLAIAYAPLVVLALRFRAGLPYLPTRPQ
jgi:Fuc2NAc and GlcNAc transferase